jgi:hypothetical protein
MLGDVYAKSGLPALAQEARARAAQTLAAQTG